VGIAGDVSSENSSFGATASLGFVSMKPVIGFFRVSRYNLRCGLLGTGEIWIAPVRTHLNWYESRYAKR
jgi:hypothetical protein